MASSPAGAWSKTTRLFPGVKYTKHVRWTHGGPLVLHVVVGPKPGGLYDLKPLLSENRITGRQTVTGMQRGLLRRANLVGVNGDFFSWHTGHTSGMLLRRGVLDAGPHVARSSLAVGADGSLRVGRIGFSGTWRAEGEPARTVRQLNRPLPRRAGYALFTPTWGRRTPHGSYAAEAILSDVRRTVPNRERTAKVVRVVQGSGHVIPAGGAVLQARGLWRKKLRREAVRGAPISIALGLDPWWGDVESALGGGPLLVRQGRPVYRADEAFTSDQLLGRHPRTAAGQTADGRILLVAVDGRSTASWGLTIGQLARQMVRLGAVEAMALDGGGSTTLAFNATVLNDPSDGFERAVADSLQIVYYGVYTPRPWHRSFSPNGDGVRDRQRLAAKIVRPSKVRLRLVRPSGRVGWLYRGTLARGTFVKTLSRRSLANGRWTWLAEATDDAGRTSRMRRTFVVNKTLGFLDLSSRLMRIWRKHGGRVVISFRLAKSAATSVTIRRPGGGVVRNLVGRRRLDRGRYAVVWDGRNGAGRFVRSGRFVVRVRAANAIGRTSLQQSVRVKRMTR